MESERGNRNVLAKNASNGGKVGKKEEKQAKDPDDLDLCFDDDLADNDEAP